MSFRLVSRAKRVLCILNNEHISTKFALSLFTSDARIEPPIHGLNRLSVGALDISFNLMLWRRQNNNQKVL